MQDNKNKKFYKKRIFKLILALGLVITIFHSDAGAYIKEVTKTAILPELIFEMENDIRTQNEAPKLEISETLQRGAQKKAEDMAKKNYFSHVTPEGFTLLHWLKLVGYNFLYAGEILAVKFSSSESVVEAWMQSPLHKANITNKNFTHTGIGIAKGIYKGVETEYVVQFFGTLMPVFNPVNYITPWQSKTTEE